MVDPAATVALVRKHGLDSLPVVSKDPLDVQAAHFAAALRAYAAASRSAWNEALGSGGAVDQSLSAQEHDRYELAATLYAPRLIEALASALLETENRHA